MIRSFISITSLAIVAAALWFSTAAYAQERLGDGALGALAGAVVAGPVGLVAGGIVGYTAGPAIASSWGLKGHKRHNRATARHRPR